MTSTNSNSIVVSFSLSVTDFMTNRSLFFNPLLATLLVLSLADDITATLGH